MFGSNHHVFVRHRRGERMISTYVVPTVKHGGGVMVWGCFARDTVCDLFRIQGTHNQHGYHSIAAKSHPMWFALSGTIICFSTGHCCVRGYLTKKESDGVLYQMTWPPQSPDLNQIEMVWVEFDRRGKEKQPTSAQHKWELLQHYWKSIPGEAG